MEKSISIRSTEITFSIWDLGGEREFVNMLPLVCNDSVAILFMFDLSRKATLNSIKEWYRQVRPLSNAYAHACHFDPVKKMLVCAKARGFNRQAVPVLVGTKFDIFAGFPPEEQEEITKQV